MAAKKTNSKKRDVTSATTTPARHSAIPPKSTPTKPTPAATATAIAPAKVATAAAPAVTTAPVITTPVVTTPTPTTDVARWTASLRSDCADTAREAAIALGNTADRSAAEKASVVATLSAVVVNADAFFHSVVRAAAAASLGQLNDANAVPALISGLRDEMAEASAEAVRALSAIGDVRAVAPLAEVVRNTNHYYLPVVRRAAVTALRKLGGEEATALLAIVAANSDEDFVVRQAAIQAL